MPQHTHTRTEWYLAIHSPPPSGLQNFLSIPKITDLMAYLFPIGCPWREEVGARLHQNTDESSSSSPNFEFVTALTRPDVVHWKNSPSFLSGVALSWPVVVRVCGNFASVGCDDHTPRPVSASLQAVRSVRWPTATSDYRIVPWTPCKWKQSLHSLRVIHDVRNDPFCVFVVFVFLPTLVCVTFSECFQGSRSHWWLGLNQNRPCVRGRMSEYFMGCEPTLGQRCSNKLCFVKRLLSWPVPSTLARTFCNFTLLDSALYFSLLSCAFSLAHKLPSLCLRVCFPFCFPLILSPVTHILFLHSKQGHVCNVVYCTCLLVEGCSSSELIESKVWVNLS